MRSSASARGNATTTRSEPESTDQADLSVAAAAFREERRLLLAAQSNTGLDLVRALTDLTLRFVRSAASQAIDWKRGWALLAVGGTGRRELCPGSDLDLVLLHPATASGKVIAATAEALWYPLWDAALKVTPSVQSIDSAVSLGDREVVSAVTWLSSIHVVGDANASAEFADRTLARWRERAKHGLVALVEETERRHERAGEVAFLLDPDLRDGRGGLRDAHVLRFLELSAHPSVAGAMERRPSEIVASVDVLLAARAELHRLTGRTSDRLALQEQDAVASALGHPNADALMAQVSAAGREIAWTTGETIRRVHRDLSQRRPSRFGRPMKVATDLGFQNGEIVLLDAADVGGDVTLTLRAAAAAAQQTTVLSREALLSLAAAPPLPSPWPARARQALVELLGAGEAAVHVFEALDRYDLLVRVLPEWAAVRSKPQRNAYHRFTVDRHLCQAAVNAAALVRTVTRPDLLLVGTWLHDIGKGFPGDHTEVGIDIVAVIGERMGFPVEDVAVLCDLVRHHLLLPEVATRRDLSDPGTINAVALAVKDPERLALLRALTEADSLATGPTAWSDWKARLMDDLVARVARAMEGSHNSQSSRVRSSDHDELLDRVRVDGRMAFAVQRETEGVDVVAIAAPDRTGLFAAIAGSLAVLGAEILTADIWTTDDGFALDLFRTTRRLGGETNWRKLEGLVDGSLDGSMDLDAELEKRAKTYARRRLTSAVEAAAPSVLIDDETPELATVVEVRAPDAPAVLYRVARAIASLGLDLRTAKVATIGHEVVDSFAVRRIHPDGTRTKLLDHDLEASVTAAILAALD